MGVGRVRQALLELMAPRRVAWPDILEPRAERRNATPKPSVRGERWREVVGSMWLEEGYEEFSWQGGRRFWVGKIGMSAHL